MSEKDPVGTDADRALWLRTNGLPATSGGPLPEVSDAELAAWLEGRLSAKASTRVEARLAADPELLSAALDVSRALRETASAPDRLVTRAQAMVGFQIEQPRSSLAGVLALFSGWRRQFELAAVTGAFLVVCVAGFSTGVGFQEVYAQERSEVADLADAAFFDGDIGFFANEGGR